MLPMHRLAQHDPLRHVFCFSNFPHVSEKCKTLSSFKNKNKVGQSTTDHITKADSETSRDLR